MQNQQDTALCELTLCHCIRRLFFPALSSFIQNLSRDFGRNPSGKKGKGLSELVK